MSSMSNNPKSPTLKARKSPAPPNIIVLPPQATPTPKATPIGSSRFAEHLYDVEVIASPIAPPPQWAIHPPLSPIRPKGKGPLRLAPRTPTSIPLPSTPYTASPSPMGKNEQYFERIVKPTGHAATSRRRGGTILSPVRPEFRHLDPGSPLQRRGARHQPRPPIPNRSSSLVPPPLEIKKAPAPLEMEKKASFEKGDDEALQEEQQKPEESVKPEQTELEGMGSGSAMTPTVGVRRRGAVKRR